MARLIAISLVLFQFCSEFLENSRALALSPISRDSHYSVRSGQLVNCSYQAVPPANLLDCAREANLQNSIAFQFDNKTNTCSVCSGETVTSYDPSSNANLFWLRWNRYWTGLDIDGDHQTTIDGGLKPGMIFEILGTLKYRINRFTVFWSQQPITPGFSDFEFKIQFFPQVGQDSQLVRLKSLVAGVDTRTELNLTPPFISLDKPFGMLVLVTAENYQVYIDGTFCCELTHTNTESELSSITNLCKAESGYHVIHSIVF